MTAPTQSYDARRAAGPHRPKRAMAAFVLMVGALALLLYRPWESRPFDILDFSEFLPLLTGESSLWDRFAAFVRHYFAEQGRANVIEYAALSLKWTLFGDSSLGWQLSRLALMLGVVAGVYLLLRRLGSSVIGAFAAAALFVVATTASQAWIRLTMGEPLGLAFILIAAHLAVGYQGSPKWRRDALLIAIALVLALLTKEMLVACVPFVLLVGISRSGDGSFARPPIDARTVRLAVSVVVLCGLALVPAALAASRAVTDSYAAAYGSGSLTPAWYLEILSRMLLMKPLLFPGNVVLVVIVLAGWIPMLTRAGTVQPWWRLALALSLPLLGAAAYVPWPRFEQFYGLPFLLGVSLLVALAITELERRAGRAAWLAYGGCLVALGYHSLNSMQSARESTARQRVNAAVASVLTSRPQGDTIHVATAYLVRQRWQGMGPTLRRYALATDAEAVLPPAVDLLCAEAARRYKLGLGHSTLVTYSNQCGSLPRTDVTVRERYRYVDWATMSVVHDSLRADILLPRAR